MEQYPGAVLGEMHPLSAQNKSLIWTMLRVVEQQD